MKMVRLFVIVILFMCLMTSCTFFKDLFLDVNKIGRDFVTAFDNLVKTLEIPLGPSTGEFENVRSFEGREIDPVLTAFMNTYVHLATGVTKGSEAYEVLEQVIAIMSAFSKKVTFVSAEKIDIPNITTGARVISPVWCGNHPAYVSKGILVKMRMNLDIPEWDSDMIVAWPLMLIDNKPYMFTVYKATDTPGEYYPFYPIPFFALPFIQVHSSREAAATAG